MSNYVKHSKTKADPQKRHPALREDGTLDMSKLFVPQSKQLELIQEVSIGTGTYLQLIAAQCLSVGGYRSGKTQGALWYALTEFILKFECCNVLVLRKTFKELESGAISDLKSLIPEELGLYKYDATRHVAVFSNGSKMIFGHCADEKERSLAQYLGQAYTFIIIDECAQFSPDAWMALRGRNAVNPACRPDRHGNLPTPAMWGLTNPMGPHWSFYHTVWVLGEPLEKPEGAKKDRNGNWFVQEAGEWICIRNKADFAFNTSNVLHHNPKFVARDPQYIANLQAMPKAKRDKWLWGYMGVTEGAYFDCWSEDFHVINLREDTDQIEFQEWQPVFAGEDWGMGSDTSGSANATYLFTRAMVKSPLTGEYRMKTVCFEELVVTGGKTYKELAQLIKAKCKLPNGKAIKLKNIFFSHEKFSRVMDAHSPAEEYSRELKSIGLPHVTRGTQNRIARASFMYNELRNGNLVILDNCKEIIHAIPRLMRDPKSLDDVLKQKNKSDDAYDGFSLGLYGQLSDKQRPSHMTQEKVQEAAKLLGPLEAFFFKQHQQRLLEKQKTTFTETKEESQYWSMQ